ncbi:nascent polypeptide-associated complex subunit alpha, muscle-specific form-like [Saccopteryx leptura]|uniref:nascent polypeptide-associated complex subunit alpha, muscle-specific form-like n=1 Tax=Saccopteryx leptura TaxID=249018 RepID=UPI00339BF90E
MTAAGLAANAPAPFDGTRARRYPLSLAANAPTPFDGTRGKSPAPEPQNRLRLAPTVLAKSPTAVILAANAPTPFDGTRTPPPDSITPSVLHMPSARTWPAVTPSAWLPTPQPRLTAPGLAANAPTPYDGTRARRYPLSLAANAPTPFDGTRPRLTAPGLAANAPTPFDGTRTPPPDSITPSVLHMPSARTWPAVTPSAWLPTPQPRLTAPGLAANAPSPFDGTRLARCYPLSLAANSPSRLTAPGLAANAPAPFDGTRPGCQRPIPFDGTRPGCQLPTHFDGTRAPPPDSITPSVLQMPSARAWSADTPSAWLPTPQPRLTAPGLAAKAPTPFDGTRPGCQRPQPRLTAPGLAANAPSPFDGTRVSPRHPESNNRPRPTPTVPASLAANAPTPFDGTRTRLPDTITTSVLPHPSARSLALRYPVSLAANAPSPLDGTRPGCQRTNPV